MKFVIPIILLLLFSTQIPNLETSNLKDLITNIIPEIKHLISDDQLNNNITVEHQKNEIFDLVIIANSTFYEYDDVWDLQRLTDWHNDNDSINTFIVNLSTIYTDSRFWVNGTYGDGNPDNPYKRADEGHVVVNYSIFNDSAAMVRNYIRYANYELGVGYALLVGDVYDYHFPIRHLYARGTGAPAGVDLRYTIVPSDVYYGCLNGTFNADRIDNYLHDGDAYSSGVQGYGWGENATESQAGIDEVDWTYEVAIGRFSVDDTTELSNIIRKTIDYLSLTGNEAYLSNISLSGGHGGWGGQAEWCAEYSRTLNGSTYSNWKSGDTTYGFDPDIYTITILDDNPNRSDGINMNDSNTQSNINAGCHIWFQSGHGSTSGWNAGGEGQGWSISDIQGLTNTNPLIMFCNMPCSTCRFDRSCVNMDQDDTFIEEWIRNYYGACAVIGNTREGWGSYDGNQGVYNGLNSSSHYVGSQMIDAYMNEGLTRLGDMLFDAKQDARPWHDTYGDGAIRWVFFEQILLGDPALELHLSKSVNQDPQIYNPSPSNGAMNQETNPTLSVDIKDNQGDSMYIIFKTNHSGDWRQIGLPIILASNGTHYKKTFKMNENMKTYWWSVSIKEIKSGNWTNTTFHFTTEQNMIFNPFLKGWKYYKQISLNNSQINGNLSNFPVLVLLNDSNLINHARPDGTDIIFMEGKGKSKILFHEIENYNNKTGELIAWVNLEKISPSQENDIYIYYGNEYNTDQQFPEMVWNNTYIGVWHFKNTDGNIHYQFTTDSTFNNLDGIPQNNPLKNICGKIGFCADFNEYGDESRYCVRDIDLLNVDEITVSCWIYLTGDNFYSTIISRLNGWQFATDYINGNNIISWWSEKDGKEVKGGVVQKNHWSYVAATFENTNSYTKLKFYIDGKLDQTYFNSLTEVDKGGDLYIGDWVGNGPNYQDWTGKLDEIRLSKLIKNESWISTEYNNQNNPKQFLKIGKEQHNLGFSQILNFSDCIILDNIKNNLV